MRSSRRSLVTSNAAIWSRSCAGVEIPAWCSPWNGTVSPAVVRRGRVVGSGARDGGDGQARGRDADRSEEPAPGDDRPGAWLVGHEPTTVAATCDSGSARASIDWLSARVSDGVRVV